MRVNREATNRLMRTCQMGTMGRTAVMCVAAVPAGGLTAIRPRGGLESLGPPLLDLERGERL